MSYRPANPQNSTQFCTTSKLVMTSIAFVAGIVVALIIAVPTIQAFSSKSTHDKADAVVNPELADVNFPSSPLKVAAFNVKAFGQKKSQNRFAFPLLVQIISRYDVILVQEVRDKSGDSLKKLWQSLNETGTPYGIVESKRLGRTKYTEQYIFFYRVQKAKLIATQQYDDVEDDFEREPFTIELSYYSVEDFENKRISLLGLHTKPKDAAAELAKLPAVMKLTLARSKCSHGIIALGDFNADCAYLNKKQKGNLELFKKERGFTSLLSESVDTTVSLSTHCAYDRAVAYGKGVKVSEARAFNFQIAFELNEAAAKQISDHYPIEFELL